MKKKRNIGCGSQGDWQLEVVLIDLHIRQCQAVIRECQTQVKQLQAERAALLAPHKKKRRRTWDDNTPMIRLVNLSQMEHFLALMSDWQKRSVDGGKLGKANITDAIAGGPAAMINGIYLNSQPENTKGEKLTSKALKDDCIFEWGYVIKSMKKTIEGKERRYQEKIPISTYGIATAQGDAPAGGGD